MANEPGSDFNRTPNRRTFRLGDTVRIKAGPLAAFTGKIEGINQARRLLKVLVVIFGRETPVKVGFAEVEKISFS
jgi:transcriptional antiterminator NusG